MRKYFFEILLVVILLLVYGFTTPQAIPLGDSGEFVAAACTLGIAHPPGFPLYVLLGKMFCMLPISTAAFRLNFMSSFFAIATAFLLTLTLLELKTSKGVAFASALMLGLAKTFWSQSVVAEVYTLNVFFVSLITFCLIRLRNNPSPKIFYLICFLFGLSLTNHWPFMMLTLPPWILYILSVSAVRSIFFKHFFRGFFFFLLPLCLYLFLPFRSLQNPYIDWGNPENWNNFWHHLLRTTTSERAIEAEGISHFKWLWLILRETCRDFLWIGPLVALVGLFKGSSLLKSERFLFITQALLFLCGIVFWMGLPLSRISLKTIQVNLLPAYYFIVLLAGLGWGFVLKDIKQSMALIPIPFLFFFHVRAMNPKPYAVVEEWGKEFLSSLKQGAIVFTALDIDSFVLAYLHGVQNIRPDVTLISEGSNMIRPRLAESVLDSGPQQIYNEQLKQQGLAGTKEIYFASKYRFRGNPELLISTGLGFQLGGARPVCDQAPPLGNTERLTNEMESYLKFDPWYVMFVQFIREPLGDYYLEKMKVCKREKKEGVFQKLRDKAGELAKNDPLLLSKLAWTSFWLSESTPEIEKWLDTSLTVSKEKRMLEVPDVFIIKGLLSARQGEWKKALNWMDKTLEKNPTHYVALILSSNLGNTLGFFERSRSALAKLESTYPPFVLREDILDPLRKGQKIPFDLDWIQRVQESAPPPMKARQ